ncbi:hypothetical protein AAHE18_08G176700 [Arachis hypogaea]
MRQFPFTLPPSPFPFYTLPLCALFFFLTNNSDLVLLPCLCPCELLLKEVLHLYKCKMKARVVIIEPTTDNCILNIKL